MKNNHSQPRARHEAQPSLNDEYLLKKAAAEIFSGEYGQYQAAQKEFDGVGALEEYQGGKNSIRRALAARARSQRRLHLAKQAKRVAAVFVLGCAAVLSTVYFTVDAARATVNNFFLELGDGYAIVHRWGDSGDPVLPEGWSDIVTPTWVPERFKYVLGTDLEDMKELIYQSDDPDEFLSISAWTNGMVPYVDQETLTFVKEVSLDGIPANLYEDAASGRYALLFVKNDYSIHIAGTVTEEEIIRLGESLSVARQ